MYVTQPPYFMRQISILMAQKMPMLKEHQECPYACLPNVPNLQLNISLNIE